MSDRGPATHVTVTAEGLRYALGTRVVLDHVDLEVRPGEVTAVVGAAGAGRTTLVRLLCARLLPTAGAIRMAGYDPVADPASIRALSGVTVENVGAWEHLSSVEVLKTLAVGHRLPRRGRNDRIAEVLALTGLSEVAEQPSDLLELADRRRLGLAGALLHDPPVLLLDALTVGLDPGSRQSLLGIVRDLADAGRTVLVTGADLAHFAEVADSAVLLENGRTGAAQPMSETDEDGRRVRPWMVRSLDQGRLSQALSRLGMTATGLGSDGLLIRLAGDAEAADLTAALAGYDVPLVALQPLVPVQTRPRAVRTMVGPRPPAEESR